MIKVPFFDYPALYRRFAAEFDNAFHDVCSRGAFILGDDLSEFEAEMAQRLDVSHVIGVADGTNAISLGLSAAGIQPGDEIIVSAHTYVATASAIQSVGAVPVPADIGPDGLLDPAAAARAISGRTRALMPTQLNGRVCKMDAIRALAADCSLMVFEDSAQAMGATYRGQAAGTFGAFGTLSFYPAKVLGCFGDGGAVLTNDNDIAARVLQMRDHGRDQTGEFVSRGTNSRLDNLQAAFLRVRLRAFDLDIDRRREIAARYHHGLGNLGGLTLPPQPDDGDHFDVYQNYEIRAERRDDLRAFLKQRGIGTAVQWGGQTLDRIAALGLAVETLPCTTRYIDRSLMLPMNMALSDTQIDHVISSIQAFFKGTRE